MAIYTDSSLQTNPSKTFKVASKNSYNNNGEVTCAANIKYLTHAMYLHKSNFVLRSPLTPYICCVASYSMTYARTLVTKSGNKLGHIL